MFATYLIGLREGLEATLVVSILVAFLVKSRAPGPAAAGLGRRRPGRRALGAASAALLAYTSTSLLARSEDRELFEAITSVAAVVFVTWMIFWMRRAARTIAGELRGKLDRGARPSAPSPSPAWPSSRWSGRAWRPRCSSSRPPRARPATAARCSR